MNRKKQIRRNPEKLHLVSMQPMKRAISLSSRDYKYLANFHMKTKQNSIYVINAVIESMVKED